MDTVQSLQVFKIIRFTFLVLTTIALAKLGVSLSDIGIYETIFFLGGAFTWFWINGLMSGLLPVYPDLNEKQRKVFLFNVFLLISAFSLLIAALLWGFKSSLIQWLTDFDDLPFLKWYCLFLVFNLPTYLVEYIYILKEKPYQIVGFGVYAFVGQFLVFVIPLWLNYSLEICFILLLLLAITKYVWLMVVLFKNTIPKIQSNLLTPYLLLSLPLIGYAFVGGMMDYIDGTIVSRMMDEEQFALYRNGARELPISIAVFTAVSMALVPIVTKNLENGLAELKRRSLRLMHPLYLLSIGLMLTSPLLFPIVFRAEFVESAWVFNVFLLLLISRVLMPQTIVIGLKYTKVLFMATCIEVVVNLALSLLLIQIWGLVGIAIATVIAFLLEKIILIIFCHYRLHIPLSDYLDLKWYTIYSVFLIASFIISFWMYGYF